MVERAEEGKVPFSVYHHIEHPNRLAQQRPVPLLRGKGSHVDERVSGGGFVAVVCPSPGLEFGDEGEGDFGGEGVEWIEQGVVGVVGVVRSVCVCVGGGEGGKSGRVERGVEPGVFEALGRGGSRGRV
jgi:hypothetical protein